MKWLKEENNRLVKPPVFDKETGIVNCHVNTTWLLNNGYNQWTDQQEIEWYKNHYKQVQINTTDFDNACQVFRQICSKIGELIGDENFKGGYDDMMTFYNHASYKTNEGMQLAIAWSGANQLCKYEANKLDIGSPQWWYKCWNN